MHGRAADSLQLANQLLKIIWRVLGIKEDPVKARVAQDSAKRLLVSELQMPSCGSDAATARLKPLIIEALLEAVVIRPDQFPRTVIFCPTVA